MKSFKLKLMTWSFRSGRVFMACLLVTMLIPFMSEGTERASAQVADPLAWTSVGTSSPGHVNQMIDVNGTLYAGGNDGVFSYDGSVGWTEVSSSPDGVYSLIEVGGTLYAGTNSGENDIWSYTSGGEWTQISNSPKYVYSFLEVGGTLYAGTYNSVWTYNNGTWTQMNGTIGWNVESLLEVNGTLYAGTYYGGLWMYSNGTWAEMNGSLSTVYALTNVNGTLYAGGYYDHVYSYTPSDGWNMMSGSPSYVKTLVEVNGTLYAGRGNGNGIWTYSNGSWMPMDDSPDNSETLLHANSKLYVSGGGSVSQRLISPEAPANLLAGSTTNTSTMLSWDAETGATSYHIYENGGNTPIATVTGATYTTISDLTPNTSYSFTLSALNAAGESSQSGTVHVQTTLNAPTGLSATAGNGQVTLTWNATPGTVTYSVYKGTASGSYGLTPVDTVTGSTYSYTATGLTNSTMYYFAVTAVNAAGRSAYSNEVSATPIQSSDSSSSTDPSPVPSSKVTSTDGKLKLPVGQPGVVTLGDELKIDIPADASGKDLNLTIEKVTDTKKLITNNEVLVSPVFEILKNFSENFNTNISLTFTFNPTILKKNQKAYVFYYDESNLIWVKVGGAVDGNKITVHVNHFTKYAVFGVDEEPVVPVDTKPMISFSDIAGHWAEAGIKLAVSEGIVSGYPDGTFKPNHTVTRAEFALMLENVLKTSSEGAALTFTDKAKIGAWAQKAVAQAVQAGIISGYPDGTFRPDAEVTRTEMAVMLAKASGQSTDAITATAFVDDEDIPVWAKGAVVAMNKLGLIEGKGANTFAPGDKTTRAEAVTVLLKMADQAQK